MGEGIFERNLLLTDFQSTLGKVEEVADFMELASGDSMVATFDQICQSSGCTLLLFILLLLAFILSAS